MEKPALEKSAKILFSNLKLFIPDLIDMVIAWGLFFILVYYTGAFDVVSLLQGATEEVSIELVTQFLQDNTTKLIISAVAYFIVTFLVGVSMVIIKYEMIKDSLGRKKTSLRSAWKNRYHYFLDVVLLRILIFMFGLLILGFGALLTFIGYLLVNPFNHDVAIVISVILSIIFLISGLVIYKLATLFRYPIMFLSKSRRAWVVLGKSISMLKKNSWFVFVTWLVVFAIGLIASLVGSGISLAGSSFFGLFSAAAASGIVATIIISFVSELIKLVGELWGQVYLFARYKGPRE